MDFSKKQGTAWFSPVRKREVGVWDIIENDILGLNNVIMSVKCIHTSVYFSTLLRWLCHFTLGAGSKFHFSKVTFPLYFQIPLYSEGWVALPLYSEGWDARKFEGKKKFPYKSCLFLENFASSVQKCNRFPYFASYNPQNFRLRHEIRKFWDTSKKAARRAAHILGKIEKCHFTPERKKHWIRLILVWACRVWFKSDPTLP